MDNVYEVMEVAEMFFLPDLKRHCGIYLSNFVETDNAVDLLCTARLFNIPRLEHHCVEFMAKNIEEVCDSFFIENFYPRKRGLVILTTSSDLYLQGNVLFNVNLQYRPKDYSTG